MTDEEKRMIIDSLRSLFTQFMEGVVKFPGHPAAKQQALFRFDEGHMWLQTAIANFDKPEQTNDEPK